MRTAHRPTISSTESSARQPPCRARAEPIEGIDTLDGSEIRQLDQILDAADTYTDWLEGRPTPTARLAHAVDTLTAVARSTPSVAGSPGGVDQTQWYQLLALAPPLHDLDREGPAPEIELGRGTALLRAEDERGHCVRSVLLQRRQ